MHRSYRVISGPCYPVLFHGKKQPTLVTANLADPADFYYDDSIRLAEKDMKAYIGKPICVEHDQSMQIGEISNVWKGADGHMWMQARIYTDTPDGIDHFERINRGDLSGLSVGYSVGTDLDGNVTHKDYHEISVCREPFFQGAGVTVCASSGKKDYITDAGVLGRKQLLFVMASETNFSEPAQTGAPAPAAAAAAVPLDSRSKDASELARQSDALLQQQAKDAARIKELEAFVAQAKKAEADRLAEYANSRKKPLEESLALLKEQWTETNPGEPFPTQFEESATNAFLHPDGAPAAAVITANALSYKKQRDALAAERAKIAELEKKAKMDKEEAEVARAHITASDRLRMTTQQETPQIAVNASAPKPNMSNLFMPSPHEKQLMKDNYGIVLDESKINVTASASIAASSPYDETTPTQRKFLPNSLFNHPQGKVIANWLRNHSDKFATARLAGQFVPTTEVMKDL